LKSLEKVPVDPVNPKNEMARSVKGGPGYVGENAVPEDCGAAQPP
jgi:hypothetical protein